MTRTGESFFFGVADHFTPGDLHGIARHFTFPAAVYYRDEIMVFDNADQMVRAHTL